jgi:WD40 repeat protein
MAMDQRSFVLDGHKESMLSAAFLNGNRQLLTLDKGLKLWTWDIALQKLLHPATELAEAQTQGIILSPKADQLVLAAKNHAKLLALGKMPGAGKPLGDAPKNLDRICFSADGKRLALAGADGIVVWDLDGPGKIVGSYFADLGVHALALSPDGKRLAFLNGYQVKLWELATQAAPEDLPNGHLDTRANHLAFTPDGRLLASANQDNTVCLWDTHAKKKLPSLQGHMCHVSSVAFSPDGKRLASGSEDWTIRIWDLESGLTTLTLKGHQGRVLTVAFDSDGQQLVSTSEDGTARVWAAPVENGAGPQVASGKNVAAKK